MIKRILARIIYEIVARYLPGSHAFINLGQEWLRRWCVQNFAGGVGNFVDIDRNASISSKCFIGNYSGIGRNAFIQGEVYIGNYVMMGPECQIWTVNHKTTRTDEQMVKQGIEQECPVYIEDDVWIGSRVTILPGIRIERGSIVGAGAVVTHNVPKYTVVGGNPAKLIRKRKE